MTGRESTAPERAWNIPAVRWLVIARGMSAVAMMVQLTVAGWYVLQQTDSSSAVGVLAALTFAPAVVGAPVGGWLAQRYDLQRLAIRLRILEVVPVAIIGFLALDNELAIPLLYLLVFLGAIPAALGTPAGGMLPPAAAPPELRRETIATVAVAYNLGRVAGPLIGSALVAVISIGGAFWFNAVLLAITVLVYRGVTLYPDQLRFQPAADTQSRPGYLRHLRRGWGFGTVRIALAGTLVFFGLVAPIQQLMPVLADDHGESIGLLSVLLLAIAVGGLMINPVIRRLYAAGWSEPFLVYAGVLGSGMCLAMLGLSKWFGVDVLLLVLLGAAWECVWVSAKASVQLRLPRELAGPIVGIFYSFVTLGTAVGALLLGLFFDLAGPRIPLLVMGMLACGYGVFGVRRTARESELMA